MSRFFLRTVQWAVLALLLLPLLAAAQDAPLEPVELRVMTFNIWLGGELVDFGKVVEAHGGTLTAENGEQEGARFVIQLPRNGSPPPVKEVAL
jgi:hypothetical protein